MDPRLGFSAPIFKPCPGRALYNEADMIIFLNGREESVDDHITVKQLIEQKMSPDRRVAVEINHEVVPRARHTNHVIQEGDRVEVVQAIGGG